MPGPGPAQVKGALPGDRAHRGAHVVDHRPGGVKRVAVVLQRPAAGAFPDGDRLVEGGDVSVGEPGQRQAGLDEQPHRDLAAQPGGDPRLPAQLGRGGQEPGPVFAERAVRRLAQHRGQLACQQVVIAGVQLPGQHQVVQERPG